MSKMASPVTGKPYGLAAVCRAWRIARSGITATALRPRHRDGVDRWARCRMPRWPQLAANVAHGLAVRHDHGSQYMSDHFQREIAFLGIESSPAFVRAPEGNGCAERFIRTLKENLLWVRHFQTIEELRQALLEFRATYNATWLIERHGFMSPSDFRQRQLQPVAEAA
jgi:transposase InsO family protein